MWAAIAGMAASAISAMGQQDTNASNTASSERQMQFQQDMFDTRYQRTVQDLQAAGLNPMLAYSQGPGVAPGGSQAISQNVGGSAVSAGASAAATYSQASQALSQADLNQAQSQKTQQDTSTSAADEQLKRALAAKAEVDARTSVSSAQNLDQQTKESIERQLNYGPEREATRARGLRDISSGKLMERQETNVQHETAAGGPEARAERDRAEAARARVSGQLLGLEVPGARAEAEKASGGWGHYVSPYLSDFGRVFSAGAAARYMSR